MVESKWKAWTPSSNIYKYSLVPVGSNKSYYPGNLKMIDEYCLTSIVIYIRYIDDATIKKGNDAVGVPLRFTQVATFARVPK